MAFTVGAIKVCSVHTPSSNPNRPAALKFSDTLRRPIKRVIFYFKIFFNRLKFQCICSYQVSNVAFSSTKSDAFERKDDLRKRRHQPRPASSRALAVFDSREQRDTIVPGRCQDQKTFANSFEWLISNVPTIWLGASDDESDRHEQGSVGWRQAFELEIGKSIESQFNFSSFQFNCLILNYCSLFLTKFKQKPILFLNYFGPCQNNYSEFLILRNWVCQIKFLHWNLKYPMTHGIKNTIPKIRSR